MELVIRGVTLYAVIWLLFRVAGKRSLRDMTAFDFVLLLIVSECTQQGLIGKDYSVTGAVIVVSTLLGTDILMSFLKQRFQGFEKVADNVPVLLIEAGHLHRDRLEKERVDESDILAAARQGYGISRMDDIEYAILETNGGVSIIPRAGRSGGDGS
jgi:uncharacterized membrane protein YcaP (DUF421 family)